MKRIVLALFLVAVAAAGVVSFLSWRQNDGDPAGAKPVLAVGVEITSTANAEQEREILSLAGAGDGMGAESPAVTIDYPQDGSIFPPKFVAPTFLWHDEAEADRWLIDVALNGGAAHIYIVAEGDWPPRGEDDPRCFGATNERYMPTEYQASAKSWTPGEQIWTAIKANSVAQAAEVTIIGFDSRYPDRPLSRGQMTLTTSADPVDGMIFYRDVPLMPGKNDEGVIKPLVPKALPLIEWRLKDISRADSRVVLTDLPTCANCHSFSADGKTLGMDIDGPTGDKGAYAVADIEPQMSITSDDVITWNEFPDKPEGHKTIGFGSQVSPDGQYAMTTVNESLYVVNFTNYKYLQVFYPTRGILAYYSRQTGEMKALSGADDPDYVHCGPAWTPDGETVVFARAAACDPDVEQMATFANDPIELQIQYDLYRIPFDGGQGGEPVRIEGASANGMSNTFPKVSPDGKWIVFVKCRNGQLMRPDGELWIVPVAGGEARRMRCSHPGSMNSWHSFSPNGRWMVFSSKVNTPYTQMFLTHIDEDGNDSPPILIPNATAANRAVNLPEFVKIDYDDLVSIETPTVEYYRHLTRGLELAEQMQTDEAVEELRKALAFEPTSTRVNYALGVLLYQGREYNVAIEHFQTALETDSRHFLSHHGWAVVLDAQGSMDEAIEHLHRALEINPDYGRSQELLNRLLAERDE